MAKIFHWSDIYTLGIVDLDEQHQKIVEFINALHEAINDGRNKDALSNALQDLLDEAQTHFGIEENLLKTHAYPEYEDHKKIHGQLLDRVLETQKGFIEGNVTLSVELTTFVKMWLSDHILRMDRKFIPYLREP
jgi:hemerythrin